MTRTISCINFKGGTGKTTIVVNLGMALALRGRRVLLVDFDPQGSLGEWLNVPRTHTLADVLLNKCEWRRAVTQARPYLDVLPSDRRLGEAERVLIERRSNAEGLSHLLVGLAQAGYDYILLDCAPAISLLSELALVITGEVLVPVSMEYLALLGARDAVIEILRARRLTDGRSARLSLITPTFYAERQIKSREMLGLLQARFPGAVSPPIRASVRISEAASHRQTIFEYDPAGMGEEDFNKLADDVIARGLRHAETKESQTERTRSGSPG